MVVELRTPGADKGDALAQIMAEPGFAGSVPYFFGDDLTDESAFAAAARFGGAGVLVGPDRPSAARFALSGVSELMAWLRRLLEAAQTKGDRKWAG
jgi:trehalose 6-phosphate phosphatase